MFIFLLVQVYAAYKSGVEALGFLRNSEGLTLEAVEDIHDEMHQLVEEGEEIAAILGEGIVYRREYTLQCPNVQCT